MCSTVHLHFTHHLVKSAHLFTHQVKTVRQVGVLCSGAQFVSVRKDMYSYSSDNHRAEAPWEPLFSKSSILFKHVFPHSFLLPTLYFLPPRLNCTPFHEFLASYATFTGFIFLIQTNNNLKQCSFDCVGNSYSKMFQTMIFLNICHWWWSVLL